jgi:hypothetical protein
MSARTLQRRLLESGVSFQQVVESARRELARHYLVHSPLEIGETAYLLGYGDTSSFVRAFHVPLPGVAGNGGGLGVEAVSEEELERLTGEYEFGSGANDRIVISRKARQPTFTRSGANGQIIHHQGGKAFQPPSARMVRISV